MQYQTQNTLAYLESENTPTVDLAAFIKKDKNKKIVKDISDITKQADKIKQIQKPVDEPIPEVVESKPDSIDGNIERRVRPLNLEFIKKKEKKVTWL